MSWSGYGVAPSRPSLRHQCTEPSPHPEVASFRRPPNARAYEDKDYFVKSSSTVARVFDVLAQGELETTKRIPESPIEWLPTSRYHLNSFPRLIDRQVYSDIRPFPCQPFVACCCGYSCCRPPDVSQQNFGSSRRRHLSESGSRYYIEASLADNILLPATFARMAYDREKWNLEGPTENHDVARKRAILLAPGISSEGLSGNEARNSNFDINDDRVYAGGCPSRFVACRTDVQMTKEASHRVQECSEQKRKFESFYEGESHEDSGKQKRFRFTERDSTGIMTDNVDGRSWQSFRPVAVDKGINACPNMDSISKQSSFSNIVSQDEIAAFRLQTNERVSSKELSYNRTQAIASASGTSEGTGPRDTHVDDDRIRCHPEISANIPSHYANENAVRSGANEASGFISLDSTRSAFFTLMNKMRIQHNVMPCPHCSQSFTQYPALKTHVQTMHQSARAFADNYAPEMQGHVAKLRSAREKTMEKSPVTTVGSSEDETSKRSTSVIMFAGQNK